MSDRENPERGARDDAAAGEKAAWRQYQTFLDHVKGLESAKAELAFGAALDHILPARLRRLRRRKPQSKKPE